MVYKVGIFVVVSLCEGEGEGEGEGEESESDGGDISVSVRETQEASMLNGRAFHLWCKIKKVIKKHNRSKEIPKGICGYITVLGEEGEGNLFFQIS